MTSAAIAVATHRPESAPKTTGKTKRTSVDVDVLIGHLKSTFTHFLTTREAGDAGCCTEGPTNSVESEMYARAYGKWLKINSAELYKSSGVDLYKTYKLTSRDPDVDFDCLFAAVEEYFDDEASRSGASAEQQ